MGKEENKEDNIKLRRKVLEIALHYILPFIYFLFIIVYISVYQKLG